MTRTIELPEGVQLIELDQGSVIDIETKSRHYSIEYLGGDQVRISGHPEWCPTPVVVRLEGSLRNSGDFEPGFVGLGMHIVFQRLNNPIPVTTTEVRDLHLAARDSSRR